MEAKKHDLRIGCPFFNRVQFLQAFHCFDPKRCCCIIQTQEIGGKIHHHMSMGRMIFWYTWKDPGKEWPNDPGQESYSARFFGDAHESHEQGHYADKTETKIDRILAGFNN